MPRLLHRLSAVQVKGLKESGYYADGNLYLQVTNASESDQFNQGGESSPRAHATRAPHRRYTGAHHDPSLRSPKGVNVAKSWVFRFTLAGRTRDMGLGKYPVVTLDKARELAGRCRQQALPRASIRLQHATGSARPPRWRRPSADLRAVRHDLHRDARAELGQRKAPATVDEHLKIYAYPLLGKLPVGISTPTW